MRLSDAATAAVASRYNDAELWDALMRALDREDERRTSVLVAEALTRPSITQEV